jgi:hypothetical protein
MRYLTAAILGAALTMFVLSAWAAIPHYAGSDYFSDVSSSSPHNHDIGYLVEYGVTQGTDATHYSPSLPVTREQMASFIMRQTTSDIALSVFVTDLVLFDGYYAYQAYLDGYVTWEEYQALQDSLDWYLSLLDYQAAAMASETAGEGPRASASQLLDPNALSAVLSALRESQAARSE